MPRSHNASLKCAAPRTCSIGTASRPSMPPSARSRRSPAASSTARASSGGCGPRDSSAVAFRERGLVHGCTKTLCYSRAMILDSLCITSWRARPVSFTSLMTLYESNFIRLQALVGDVRRHVGSKVSSVNGDCDLHLEVLEHAPYTSMVRLTYRFEDAAGTVADPDLELRVYHDARLAEASQCGRWIMHPSL